MPKPFIPMLNDMKNFLLDVKLHKTAKRTVSALKRYGLRIALAESCTGGMTASLITSVSGASQVFELGVAAYSCSAKNRVLGVKKETLEKYGAVSEQTAAEMAMGVRSLAEADIGASVTGVAGPDCSEGHPPGYVYIAVSGEKGNRIRLLSIPPKGRAYVRKQAVSALLTMINEYAEEINQ